MQDAAFAKAQENPHAQGAVQTIETYVAGRGVAVSSSVPEVDAVIQEFWRVNAMASRHKAMVRSVYIEGEYYAKNTIHRQTGNVTLRRIPAKEIVDVETDPEDIETKYSYARKYVDANDQTQERWYADVAYYDRLAQARGDSMAEEDLPRSRFHDRLRQIVQDDTYGDVLVQQVRWGEEGEKRGRVPMAAVLPYFEMLKQLHQDIARRAHEQAKVIWLKKITGRTSEATTREHRAPAGGVMLVETDTVSYRSETPQLGASEMETTRRMLIHTIGAGLQIPEYILDANAENENYSSVKKADTPFIQGIMKWQDFWDDTFQVMLRVPILAKVRAGKLKETIAVTQYIEESLTADSLLQANAMLAQGIMESANAEGIVHASIVEGLLGAARRLLEGQEEQRVIPVATAPITVIFPVLVHEDPLAQAQALQIWQQLGVSQQTLLEKLGLDWKTEWVRQKAMREMLRQEQETARKALERTPGPPSYEGMHEGYLEERTGWHLVLVGKSQRSRERAYQAVREICEEEGESLTGEDVDALRQSLAL
jgi:hypothetical protein